MAQIIESSKDPVLQEDLEENAALLANPAFDALRGSTVLVTGATGLVGSELVKTLACANRVNRAGMTILALVRNVKKAEAIYGELLGRGDINLIVTDIVKEPDLAESIHLPVDYVIHGAAVTASKLMVEKPAETIRTAIDGTESLLRFARETHVKSMVYLSSMEVYGHMDTDEPVTEDRMGYVDPLVVRSNYPLGKRMCENMCAGWASEYGVPVKIARLSQTFGAGVLPGESRVFAQFARSVMHGENIVLHTKGLSEGNYCYTADTVRGILTILLSGQTSEAYNVSNEASHTTIAGMAEFAARVLAEGKISVVYDIPETNVYGYAADTRMKLSSGKLRTLGWEPRYDLETSFRRLIASLRAQESAAEN